MKLITVIVPIYNSEKYLKRCLNSIVNQTYSNIEIILIDDGSTDNSLKICNEYKKNDNRIQVIHTNNKGQSSARNLGIKICKGEILSFIDSDDWIPENLFEIAVNNIEKYNLEVIDFESKLVSEYENKLINDKSKINVLDKQSIILEDYLYMGLHSRNSPFSPCKKLYLKKIWNNISFPEGRINEDIITIYRALSNIKRMGKISEIGYYYFQNSSSTTIGTLKERDFDLIIACEEICDLALKSNNKKIIKYAFAKKARSYFSLLAKAAYYGIDNKIDKKKTINELTNKLRSNFFRLMFSPIPLNRKILIIAFCIDYHIVEKIINIKRRIKEC